ncbi:MAG: hypothetical protein RIQ33_2298 [Bacteroidota bacterium]|jgi:hypothetical protein
MEEPQSYFDFIRPFINIPFALISGYIFFKIHRWAKKTSHGNARWMGELIGWGGMFLAGLLFLYRAIQGFMEWFVD